MVEIDLCGIGVEPQGRGRLIVYWTSLQKYYFKWKWQINIIKEGRREFKQYIIWANVDNFLIATLPFSLRQHLGRLKQDTKVGQKDYG